jgi:hypothetical protein
MKLAKAKMIVELEDFSQGKSAALFHRNPEQVSGIGTVVKKSQVCLSASWIRIQFV